ncbi:MAG: cytochrome c biogenesis protein ResB [Syntrophales bacterium]|nr:cytochrome c biogenesis protein ResB [Syntrophales bacterium]
MSKHKSGFRSFFSSVQLTIVLFGATALLSIIGTVVPQQEGAREFAEHLAPGLASFLQSMQVFDLYHSIWFFLITGLLFVNLIVCSLDRLPGAWRRFRREASADGEGEFKGLKPENMIRVKVDQKTAVEAAAAVMKSRFGNFRRQDADGSVDLVSDKGRISYLGVYIVHLSILFLIAGAITGSLFGTEGYVNISEGETVNAIDLRGGKGTKTLPFSVRCDRFTVEFYEGGAPKTYRSDLSFLKNDQVSQQGALMVNHPMSFDGFRFYQASYGRAPESKSSLTIIKDGKPGQDIGVGVGDVIDLPGGEGKLHILRIEENLMQMGPAIKLSVKSPQGETIFWVFRHIDKIKEANPGLIEKVPLFNPGLFKPYVFVMNDMAEKYYTGLQVSRDPGVPLVALAAILMIAGLLVVFLMNHRQIRIRIDREKGEYGRIAVAGKSHRNAVATEREIARLLEEIRVRLGVKS